MHFPVFTRLSTCVVFLLTACGSVQQATSTRIGVQPLTGFSLRNENLPADTLYKVFRSDEQFDVHFLAATADVKRPDFRGQTAFAILFRQAPEKNPLVFEKVEIKGSTMMVYAAACAPSTGQQCPGGKTMLGATAKSNQVKKVQFFINGESKTQVEL